MPVVRVELTGIEAKRYTKANERVGQIRIDHNSTVTLVRAVDAKEANVEFRYTASYGSVGVIRIEGNMTFQCDAKTLEEQWRTTNQMGHEAATEIHSTVMRACVPQAVGIAKDLALPLPIPIPQVNLPPPPGPAKPAAPTHGPEVM